jgi:hypothetical protein
VFVSSTLGELADERRAVSRAISALRLTPVMFEAGARPHPPQDLYRAYLAQSDAFVGLYWQQFGWVGLRPWPLMRRVEAELVAQVHQALGADRFDQPYAAGSRLSQQEAVAAVRARLGGTVPSHTRTSSGIPPQRPSVTV